MDGTESMDSTFDFVAGQEYVVVFYGVNNGTSTNYAHIVSLFAEVNKVILITEKWVDAAVVSGVVSVIGTGKKEKSVKTNEVVEPAKKEVIQEVKTVEEVSEVEAPVVKKRGRPAKNK